MATGQSTVLVNAALFSCLRVCAQEEKKDAKKGAKKK